ncbi:MAG: molecular chaperone HtpG, partial [Bacteroidetes bacterium]
ELKSYRAKIEKLENQKNKLNKAKEGKKEEAVSQEEKDEINKMETKIKELEDKRNESLEKYGKDNKIVCQLIGLALISSNMLKGENLTNFVKRSIDLI